MWINKNFLLLMCLIIIIHLCFNETVVIINDKDIPELKYLDTTADPCENFYEYSCGNFRKYHPLNEKSTVNQFTILSDEILKIMKSVLVSPNKDDDAESAKKVKTAYESCVYKNFTDQWKPIPEVIMLNSTGGMPLLTKPAAPDLKFGWNDIGRLTAEFGVPLLFRITVVPFPISTTDNLITLDEDTFPNPSMAHPHHELHLLELLAEDFKNYARNHGENKNKRHKPFDIYLRTVLRVLRDNVNPKITDEEINEGIEEVAKFMRKIHIYEGIPENAAIEPMASTTTIGELQSWTDEQFSGESLINWIHYFDAASAKSGAKVDRNTNIFVNTTYIYNVLNMVKNTDPKVVKNFALLRILLFSSLDGHWQLRKALYDYYEAKNYTIYSREDYCARQLIDVTPSEIVVGMSLAAGSLLADNNSRKTILNKAKEMIEDIFKTFETTLTTSQWMDEESKAAALRKANNMLSLVGLPAFANNLTELDQFYKNLQLSRFDNYGNMQKLRAFKLAYMFSQIGRPRDRAYWDKSPFDTNAFYNRANNKIIIPFALLNPVFFGAKLKIMDYSHLGFLVGHETTHGFDNAGRQYNENATLGNLWTNETLQAFQNRSQCFRNQYSGYFIEELNKNMDGDASLNENLADNGGIRISYTAAKKMFDSFQLKSKKFSPEQLFFIGFGTTFCSVDSMPYLEYTLNKGYAPSMFRVIGAVSNMVEFSNAFNCPKNSSMNPEKKCFLW